MLNLHRDKNSQGKNKGEMERSCVVCSIGGIGNLARWDASAISEMRPKIVLLQVPVGANQTTTEEVKWLGMQYQVV